MLDVENGRYGTRIGKPANNFGKDSKHVAKGGNLLIIGSQKMPDDDTDVLTWRMIYTEKDYEEYLDHLKRGIIHSPILYKLTPKEMKRYADPFH